LNTGRHTRREFLKAVGAGTAWITLLNVAGCEPPTQPRVRRTRSSPSAQSKYVQAFRSRSDLTPPTVGVSTQAHDTAPSYIFIAPKKGPGQNGPMIIDNLGQLVWFYPRQGKRVTDFKVQHYQGKPVLTWWEGRAVIGHGVGEYVILDSSYQEMTRVQAGNGYNGDLHEFLITQQDTALLTAYNPVRRDLSSVGGPKDGVVLDGIAQEVDIETGEVLFEWHSLDHVGLDESYSKPDAAKKPFDYFHINSIDVDHHGNLIISARKTSAVYKINRETGEVIWRLGGKESTFEMGPGTRTVFQHDARSQPDGTITIFDNAIAPKVHGQSRGIVVKLDEDNMIATLVREYPHPDKLFSATQGNMQVLPDGNVFIGWGSKGTISEFSSDGRLLFNASIPPKDDSYRAFRFSWSGHPSDDPAVALEPAPENGVTLYASWNGATEVDAWQVLAGPSPKQLKPVGESVPPKGFETAIAVRTAESYVAVQAKHRSGQVLGTSKALKPGN
jgi:outer membrane protein assembly factor BamB